jgi:hypothetical protein
MAELMLTHDQPGGIRELSLKNLHMNLPKKLLQGDDEASTSSSPLRSQPSTGRARRAVPFIIGVAGGTASGKTVRREGAWGAASRHLPDA